MFIYRPAKTNKIIASGHLITKEGLKSGVKLPELSTLVKAGILELEEVNERELQAKAEKERQEAKAAKEKAERLAKEAKEAQELAKKEEEEAVAAEKKVSKKKKNTK